MADEIDILAVKTLSKAWGTLTSTRFRMRGRDGAEQTHEREVYDHGHAAAVLPYCPETGSIVLVRQFRYPPHWCGDSGFLLEVPAGLLDGDLPEACARREAEEETGLRLGPLQPAFATYVSPGSLTEKVSCFTGRYGAGDRVSAGGGVAGEGEDIEVVEMRFAAALALIAGGGITDAKTIMLLQHAALCRLL